MISVDEALAAVLSLAKSPGHEVVSLRQADGRVLAEPAVAARAQPPFPASAMDGYAVQNADVGPGATFEVIGESAAGHGYEGSITAGQAVRIFTGAPVPDGADRIIIQEDVTVAGDQITLRENLDESLYVRPAGADFPVGFEVPAPVRLTPNHIALLAAMNINRVTVVKRPDVAIIATGDELVHPGETPKPDQIVASNTFGLAALLTRAGAKVRVLPIARDNASSLAQAFELATGADVVITIGGASVGDHDVVAIAAAELGLERKFYKVAMRPGKPLMAGQLGNAAMIGLPGNPVSAMVCGTVFVEPLLRSMQGLPSNTPTIDAVLTHELPKNGPRAHYMRADLSEGKLTVFERQDSALLNVLAQANVLAIRPPNDPPKEVGDVLKVIQIL